VVALRLFLDLDTARTAEILGFGLVQISQACTG